MSVRLAGWIVLTLALAAVLSIVAPWLMLLAVPLAVMMKIVATRYGKARRERDLAGMLVSEAAALPGERLTPDGVQVDWGAALRAELATIVVPRERRRFALGATAAMLGTPHRLRSGLIAVGAAAAFAAGLLALSRATVGDDGLGSVTVLVPPVMLFTVGLLCARSTRSLRFGAETGIVAAVLTLVAMVGVFGIEAARWFDAAHVSILDGEYIGVDTSRAAVLDAIHPAILLAHLVFWLPWPVLGAVAGARAQRHVGPAPAAS